MPSLKAVSLIVFSLVVIRSNKIAAGHWGTNSLKLDPEKDRERNNVAIKGMHPHIYGAEKSALVPFVNLDNLLSRKVTGNAKFLTTSGPGDFKPESCSWNFNFVFVIPFII